jgi:hypothetical protein
MYFCVRDIDVASFYHFDISVCNCYDRVVFYSKTKVNLRCMLMHAISFPVLYTFFVKSDKKIVCPTNTCNVLFIYSLEFNLLRDETSLVC